MRHVRRTRNAGRLPLPNLDLYEWQFEGRCLGMPAEVFFSPEAERGEPKQRREEHAKSICRGCPVIERCRDHALAVREPYGVWGGLSVDERAAVLSGGTDTGRTDQRDLCG